MAFAQGLIARSATKVTAPRSIRSTRPVVIEKVPAEDLAEALIALAIGLGMAALLDRHSVRRELFGEIASLLYDGLAHRAERGPTSGRRT